MLYQVISSDYKVTKTSEPQSTYCLLICSSNNKFRYCVVVPTHFYFIFYDFQYFIVNLGIDLHILYSNHVVRCSYAWGLRGPGGSGGGGGEGE